jgi:phospholipid transport system substrate-binding protein
MLNRRNWLGRAAGAATAALALAGLAVAAPAAEPAPDQVVRGTVDKVIAVIKVDKAVQAGDSKRIFEVVESLVLPHFNFTRMTRLAMGANWKLASAQQQDDLVREFRALLVRTYSVALKQYRDETIEVRPVKLAAGQDDVQVRTFVNRPGAKAIAIDYDMERTPHGWKVYDVSVAGVSLVINFRSSFDGEIRKGGVDGLIRTLAERNRGAGGTAAAARK